MSALNRLAALMTPELIAIARERLEESLKQEKELNGWVRVQGVDDVRIIGRDQFFAVTGVLATGLVIMDDAEWTMFPAVIDGKVWSIQPEEGSGGYLHLGFKRSKERWVCLATNAGWLQTSELLLTPVEIADHIEEEALASIRVFWIPDSI